MTLPHQGGSYRRDTDGSLTRIDASAETQISAPAEAPAVIEQEAEQPAESETQSEEQAGGRKGKA